MQKKIFVVSCLVLVVAVASVSGCGGSSGSKAESEDATALLIQAGQAVSEQSSYRMSGKMNMDSSQSDASTPIDITLDIDGEVQQSGGTVKRHVVMSAGDLKQEYYIMGSDYYLYNSNGGWEHASLGAYETQNAGMGMIDIQQLGLMAGMAQDAQVFEEDDSTLAISFHLNEDFFKASLPSPGQGFSQEELDAMAQYVAGIEADVRMWFAKDSMLVEKTEIESNLGDMPPYDSISTSVNLDILDYNANIEITLPEEAKNAVEMGSSSNQ
jgi:hypothetical protein